MKVNVGEKKQRPKKFQTTHKIENFTENDSDDSRTISISDLSANVTASSEYDTNEPIPLIPAKDETFTVHSAEDMESIGIPILQEAIDTKPNQILVFTWHKNYVQVRDLSHEKQKILEVFLPINNDELIKQFLKEYIKYKIKYFIYFESKEHRKQFSKVIIQLFKKGMVEFVECTERVVFVEDENEQKEIILQHHEGKTCHRGIKETMSRIRRNYFWNNMQEMISAVINNCEACCKTKYDRNAG